MRKKEKLELLNILKASCEEGMDGRWDCSTEEGREAFGDMIELLDRLIKSEK